ncbi:hypothetical protein HU200_002323 [Digitaria exilis]|uniref:Uncharacterized protein n=2 Tax=PACMAD clade TaxID=147370 RepID=A0A835FYE7_9POAL|nr:hypothetical protein HU200_002323 [Digitaria exilis]
MYSGAVAGYWRFFGSYFALLREQTDGISTQNKSKLGSAEREKEIERVGQERRDGRKALLFKHAELWPPLDPAAFSTPLLAKPLPVSGYITAQEREVQLLQGRQAWPFHMMGMATTAGGCFDGYGYGGGGGDCFVLGWEQQPPPAPFGCFGLLAADVQDLFPFCTYEQRPITHASFHSPTSGVTRIAAGMESPVLQVPSAPSAPPPPAHDAVAPAIPGELDDLLLNFWDGSCHDGDVGKEEEQLQLGAFNSSCVTHEQTTMATCAAATATTTNCFFHCELLPRARLNPPAPPHDDDADDPLSSIFCTGPTSLQPAEKAVVFQAPPAAAEVPLLSSSSSSYCLGAQSDGDAQAQAPCAAATPSASRARTPPLPRSSSTSSTPSLKRATREGARPGLSSYPNYYYPDLLVLIDDVAVADPFCAAGSSSASDQTAPECGQSESSKRRKTAAPPSSAGVVCPFALLKPDGLDGGATLADINTRILMRPARPVRHPVGEFACAPRVSADQPGISGKAVSSFTRLHTPGRGTITIIRTRG